MHMLALITTTLHTKFEMSSFVRCKYMTEAAKLRNGSRDYDHAEFGDNLSLEG